MKEINCNSCGLTEKAEQNNQSINIFVLITKLPWIIYMVSGPGNKVLYFCSKGCERKDKPATGERHLCYVYKKQKAK